LKFHGHLAAHHLSQDAEGGAHAERLIRQLLDAQRTRVPSGLVARVGDELEGNR